MKQQKMDRCLAAPAAEASQLCLGAAASMPTPKAVPAAYRIVIGVTPREHSIVAFLWAFKNLVRQNRNKAIIVLCDAYSETRHIAPLSYSHHYCILIRQPLKDALQTHLRTLFAHLRDEIDYEFCMTRAETAAESLATATRQHNAMLLVVGEKHALEEGGTRWSHTTFDCLLACVTTIVVVRPTCFDIYDGAPLIEVFRHPQFAFEPVFSFAFEAEGGSSSSVAENNETAIEAPTSVTQNNDAQSPEGAPTKKNFFTGLLKKKAAETAAASSSEEEAQKTGVSSPPKSSQNIESQKQYYMGPVKK